jgi:hypothetical protein
MNTTRLLIVSLAFAFFLESAPGQDKPTAPATPRITHKQVRQQTRIKQGVKSGEVTPGESKKLETEQAKIQSDKKDAKSDGTVTPKERRSIRHEQRKASRDIYKAKHNEKTTN